jgi:hypothetical protein
MAPAAAAGGLLGALFAKPLAIGLAVIAVGAAAGGVYALRGDEPAPAASSSPAVSAIATAGPDAPIGPARVSTVATPPAPTDAPSAPVDPPPAAAEKSAALEVPSAASSSAPVSAAVPAHAASPVAKASNAEPAAGRDTELAAERALLEEARTAVAQGHGAEALDAVERHGRAHPGGRLSEEREALRIRALVAAGRTSEARERAARFKAAFPKSLLLPAVEASVASIP